MKTTRQLRPFTYGHRIVSSLEDDSLLCDLCTGQELETYFNGSLLISQKGYGIVDEFRCPRCEGRLFLMNDDYSPECTIFGLMLKHHPDKVHDIRDTIDVFAPFEGFANMRLDMKRVFKSLEYQTFRPDMMELNVAFAHALPPADRIKGENHLGVMFRFAPKLFEY